MRNITISGSRPSSIRHALLNGGIAPGGVDTFWNMKYINVITRLGTTMIMATLRWSAASWRRMRTVVARYGRRFRRRRRCCAG